MTIRTDTIVTRYEANVVSHVQSVEQIRQKQQQLKMQLDDWNASVKHHEEVTAKAWKTAAAGVAAFGAAIAAGVMSFRSYAETAKMETAALGADIEGLSKASAGLKSRTELLSFAAKAQHGVFQLSNEEMQIAVRAMRALTNEGRDAAQVHDKITEAIVKGEVEGLKELGVTVVSTRSDLEKMNRLTASLGEDGLKRLGIGLDKTKTAGEMLQEAAKVLGETTLTSLGVKLSDTSSKAERQAALMETLAARTKGVDDSVKSEVESIQSLGVRFEDTFDRIKRSVAEMVIALEPLIEAAATLGEKAGGLIEMISDGWGGLADAARGDREALFRRFGRDAGDVDGGPANNPLRENFRGKNGVLIDGTRLAEFLAAGGTLGNFIDAQTGHVLRDAAAREQVGAATSVSRDNSLAEVMARQKAREELAAAEYRRIHGQDRAAATPEQIAAATKARARAFLRRTLVFGGETRNVAGGSDPREQFSDAWLRYMQAGIDPSSLAAPGEFGRAFVDTDEFGRPVDPDLRGALGRLNRGQLTASWNERLQAYRDKGKLTGAREEQRSQLEQIFGPIKEFDAYAKGFEMLSGAATSAFGAWIDGSMSAGAAIKKFFADSLKGMAVDLAGKAIVHAAYAIGSLAFGDAKGAATHGAAAAKAAAGAIALGVLAKTLSPGGDGGAGGAASSAGSGGAAAPRFDSDDRVRDQRLGGGGGNTYVISYSDSFTSQSPRERQRTSEDLLRLSLGFEGVVT